MTIIINYLSSDVNFHNYNIFGTTYLEIRIEHLFSFLGVVFIKLSSNEKMPKFRRQFWQKKWTEGQTDGEVHNYNILGTTYMEMRIERLTLSKE